jgi:ribosomal protein S18 acetylase RimI-like enzyme
MNDLLLLNKSCNKAATEMLTQAFQHFPLLKAVFPGDSEREKIAFYLFQYDLGYCFRYGEVYATSAALEGVAAWFPSSYYPRTLWNLICSVPLSVTVGFIKNGGARMKFISDYIAAMHKRLAPFKHWYLCILGVAPEFQGKGYASRLLWPMLARIDEEGLPCYLETMGEANARLYEHFGFKVIEKATIPGTDLTNLAMLRDAH